MTSANHLEMMGNQIRNVVLHHIDDEPIIVKEGTVLYDPSTKKIKFFDGENWQVINSEPEK